MAHLKRSSLSVSPRISFGIDHFLYYQSWMKPRLYDNLREMISTFPSIYELLPDTGDTMVRCGGSHYSAFAWPGWGDPKWKPWVNKHRTQAPLVKQQFNWSSPPFPIHHLIFSLDKPTEHIYETRARAPYTFLGIHSFQDGDGTVSQINLFRSSPPAWALSGLVPGEHLDLVNLSTTHTQLNILI
jgi:hypothetical protein